MKKDIYQTVSSETATLDAPIAQPEKALEAMSGQSDVETIDNVATGELIDSINHDLVRKRKISMLSAPNRIEAFVPNLLASEDELVAVGLEKEIDANGAVRWYVPNRAWFPAPLTNDSIVINYGMRKDGSADLGFCNQEEFSKIYALSDKYNEGIVEYIDPATLSEGEIVQATKCASGEFVIVPVGTDVVTQEGPVTVQPGQVLVINESRGSIFATDVDQLLQRYVPDPSNPASSDAFDLMKNYCDVVSGDVDDGTLHELMNGQFSSINRDQKRYKQHVPEISPDLLRQDYERARGVVKELSGEILPQLDALNFDEKIEQARDVLMEIYTNPELSESQRSDRLVAVMTALLPKTNNHQHLKGSTPMNTLMELAEQHGFSEEQIAAVRMAYAEGEAGFKNLDDFNRAYGIIARAVQTPMDYRKAVAGIMTEAARSGQLTVEVRCSVIGQRSEDGRELSPEEALTNLINASDETRAQLEAQGATPLEVGITLLGYRGRDWHPEEVVEHARIAVRFAKAYPDRSFSFDIAGPEDTGYSPKFFEEAYRILREYNMGIDSGELRGEKIGITTHAGETPTYDGDPAKQGTESILEAIEMGADRIGHGVQAVHDPEVLQKLKEHNVCVEICGVCNVLSIPINTEGMTIHPVEKFIEEGIPVTICTDNDSICGTNITEEYMQLLFTGHGGLMNWTTLKEVARAGVERSFVGSTARIRALDEFNGRVRKIEKLLQEFSDMEK